MFCPRCRDEFVAGVARCPDCEVDLVEELPAPTEEAAEEPAAPLESVFRSGSAVEFAFAEAVLEEAGISVVERGEGLQDLFGAGRLGTGFSTVVGPPELLVAPADAETARGLLSGLKPGEGEAIPAGEEPPAAALGPQADGVPVSSRFWSARLSWAVPALLFGVAALAGRQLVETLRMEDWNVTEASIVDFGRMGGRRQEFSPIGRPRFHPSFDQEVFYEYRVRGRVYSGRGRLPPESVLRVLRDSLDALRDSLDAAQRGGPQSPGMRSIAYYDPDDPARSRLEGPQYQLRLYLLGLLCLAAGVWCVRQKLTSRAEVPDPALG